MTSKSRFQDTFSFRDFFIFSSGCNSFFLVLDIKIFAHGNPQPKRESSVLIQ